MEAAGLPTITIIGERFESIARILAEAGGMGTLPLLIEPASPGTSVTTDGLGVALAHYDEVICALTVQAQDGQAPRDGLPGASPVPKSPAGTAGGGTAVLEVADYGAWDDLVRARGWTDGLPVAPPAADRVDAIIDYLGLDRYDSLGRVGPAGGDATIEQIAIQCAMAGCRPEHVPVVLAALEAMLEPSFNLGGMQATTNPCAPLAVVCGPIVSELDFNVGDGVFGGGGWANAAIGRAIRLVLWNIGGGVPGRADKSPLGQPAKYAFCIGEGRDGVPWTSLASDFGFAEDTSCVVVFACQSPYPFAVAGSAERMLRVLAESIPSTGLNHFHAAGQMMLTFTPRVALALTAAGYTREDVRRYIFEHARYDLGDLRRRGLLDAPDQPADPVANYWGSEVLAEDRPNTWALPDDALLKVCESEQDVHVLISGGTGQFFIGFSPGWGGYGGYAVARPIIRPSS
jgi:hypothetical protein